MRRAAAICWITAGCGYVILEAAAAVSFKPHYGYASNLISDLGRPGLSSLAPVMNVAFVLQGSLFLVAAVLVSRRSENHCSATVFVGFAAANAVGNIVVAIIHSGSWPHVAGAVLAIVGGNAAVLAGFAIVDTTRRATWYRAVSRGLAAVGLIAFAALATQTVAGTAIAPNAVLERVSVYTIIGWQVISAIQLLRTRAVKNTPPC